MFNVQVQEICPLLQQFSYQGCYVIRPNGEVIYEDEDKGEQENNEYDEESPFEGEVLVILRARNSQAFEDGSSQQRENIFQTRCNIYNKACNIIIDSGNCTTVVSSYLVEKTEFANDQTP